MTRNGLHLVVTILLTAVIGLTACGRKGPLERPPHAEKSAADASGPAKDKNSDRPDRPFVLDKLIR